MARLQLDFFSQTLGLSTNVTVLLPSLKLAKAPAGGWPVLWLLHGLSDDHTAFVRNSRIEHYARDYGLAVVMPAVGRSFYRDMAAGLPYATYLREELPEVCRSYFQFSSNRGDNFIAGFSMGGYGAVTTALSCPENYAAVASISGVLDVCERLIQPALKGVNLVLSKEELETVFGDLGQVAGSDADPLALVQQAAAKQNTPALFACCGKDDFLYPHNLAFRDACQAHGLPLEFHEAEGAHNWDFVDAWLPKILAWLPLSR